MAETHTSSFFFFFSDFCLKVLGVNVDKVLLFGTSALPAAKTAAAETAAARENAAAHKESLTAEEGKTQWMDFKQLNQLAFKVVAPAGLSKLMLPTLNQHLDMRK